MGHYIGERIYSKRMLPKTIVKDLNRFAYDPQEASSYHGQIVFHEKPVYKNIEQAREAIKQFDRGWYDDHAVVFKDDKKHLKWLVKYEYHC